MRRIRKIGQGGLGIVDLYLTQQGHYIAIKQMLYKWDNHHFERFKREIRIMSTLTHKNIVKLLKCDVLNENPWYAMPYFKDGSLRDKLSNLRAEGKIYNERAASAIIYYLADALSYAHKRGVIHRDLKPENILFKEREPMIADWGIGKFIHKQSKVLTNGPLGTRSYCSPEQWNSGTADARSDIFSLGLIYRELITGEIYGKVQNEKVNKIINKMTYQSPDDRFQNMEQVKNEIKSLNIISDEPLNDFWNAAFAVAGIVGIAMILSAIFEKK